MKKNRLLISTVGTSLLTNLKQLTEDEKSKIYKHANAKTRDEIPREDLKIINELIYKVYEHFTKEQTCEQERQKMSAEYNAIARLRDASCIDQHILIATDTWLGEETANILRVALGNAVIIKKIHGLQTKDHDAFRAACIELALLCKETFDAYHKTQTKIIYNLTGGFKAVQGMMQTLGMLYADEVVYIFERSENLIRIPKLPILMDATSLIRKSLRVWRRLAIGLRVLKNDPDLQDIPDFYFLPVDDEIILSEWGTLVWREASPSILSECLWPSPDDKLRFGPQFEKSIENTSKEEMLDINIRIAELAKHLNDPSFNPNRLDFKKLNTKYNDSTHECDAWARSGGKRLFGHFEGNTFVLDRLDKGLH